MALVRIAEGVFQTDEPTLILEQNDIDRLRAEVSNPINPLVMFLLAGAVISSLAVFMVEWIDQRANWPKQVVASTGFSAIGRLRNLKKHVEPEFMVRRQDATGVESFRMAKTRLVAALGESERGHSVLVASPSPSR